MTREELLSRLEEIIGSECYNSSIQNYGRGGEWEGEGRDFRYPVTYFDRVGSKRKSYSRLPTESYRELRSAYYAFGANQLHIVRALDEVLDFLAEEFSLVVPEPRSED